MCAVKTTHTAMHENMHSRLRGHMSYKDSSGSNQVNAGNYLSHGFGCDRKRRTVGKLAYGYDDNCHRFYATNGGRSVYRQRTFSRVGRGMDGENSSGPKVHADFSVNRPVSQTARGGSSAKNSGRQLASDRTTQATPYNSTTSDTINPNIPPCKFESAPASSHTSRPTYQHTKDNIQGNTSNSTNQGSNSVLDPVTCYTYKAGECQVDAALSSIQNSDTTADIEVQGAVKKLSQENKSNRQQQMYQEDQPPIPRDPAGPKSTQFFSQVTKFPETKFPETKLPETKFPETGYYGYGNEWQPTPDYPGAGPYQDATGAGYQPTYNKNKVQYHHLQNGYPQQNGYSGAYNSGSYPYQQPYMSSQNTTAAYSYGNRKFDSSFCPIRSHSSSPSNSSASNSPCDLESQCPEEFPGSVDLSVGNLDYNISPREWKHILSTTFNPHVKILWINVTLQPDNTSLGVVKVGSIDEARFAISQFHRKKIGYKRIHVTLKNEEGPTTTINLRSEVVALLSDAKGNFLPLFKFIELYHKRYQRSISVLELYKMEDTIDIRKQGGAGRMVHLVPALQPPPIPDPGHDTEVHAILQQSICQSHCPEGSTMYSQMDSFSTLPNVKLQLTTFSAQVHSLLMSHDGHIPLLSFPACYMAEFSPLIWVLDGGVPLEHLISCVPGIELVVSSKGIKKVSWAENKPPGSPELGRQCSSVLLVQQLNQFSRDIIDLLKIAPNCRLSGSNFIHSYQHHFGRQCRVADYGYSRLSELFDAIPHVLQIIGTGDRKVLTLTHRVQSRRFSSDLIRLLKASSNKKLSLSALPQEFSKMFSRSWDIVEYGVCCIEDMLSEIPPSTVTLTAEGHDKIISIPRKDQTTEETERTKQFCLEVVDLLKHNHECRMLFNKFIPAYHHHFGRQCRVSDYGFAKLLDLFESIPQIVEVVDEQDEKIIRLTEPELRKVIGEQIGNLLKQKNIDCFPLEKLESSFTMHYGFPLPLQDFGVSSVEELMSKKMKHALKLETYDGKRFIVLVDRTSTPPLARQVLQLLMDQSGGSLPLMELCSRYKTTFGIGPDIQKIKEELLDYVQVLGDEDSGVISLAPLQVLARDIRLLLQMHGKVSMALFDQLFREKIGSEIKPALYGYPTTVALLLAIPHVVNIKGKGYRKMVHLSGDLQGSLPIIDESYTRDVDTTLNGSGSELIDEEHTPVEPRKFSPLDLLSGSVPTSIPSPNILPDIFGSHDLINLATPPPVNVLDQIFAGISDDEKQHQISPLCHTPTSELLHLAAQCLPSNIQPPRGEYQDSGQTSVSGDPSQDIMDLLQNGWWRASPAQLDDGCKAAQSNALLNLINNRSPSETGATDNIGTSQSQKNNSFSTRPDRGKFCIQSQSFDMFTSQLNRKGYSPSYHVSVIDTKECPVNNKMDVGSKLGDSDTPNTPLYSQIVAGTYKATENSTDHSKAPPNTPMAKIWNTDSAAEGIEKDDSNSDENNKYLKCIQSVSATLTLLRKDNANETKNCFSNPPGIQLADSEIKKDNSKIFEAVLDDVDQAEMKNYIATCPRPLQPGSYWYAKIFENNNTKNIPSSSSQDVRNLIDSLSNKKPVSQYKTEPKVNSVKPDISAARKSETGAKVDDSSSTLTESIDTCESFSRETITDINKTADQEITRPSQSLNYAPVIHLDDTTGDVVNEVCVGVPLSNVVTETCDNGHASDVNMETVNVKQDECAPGTLGGNPNSTKEIRCHVTVEPTFISIDDSATASEAKLAMDLNLAALSEHEKQRECTNNNSDGVNTESPYIPALDEPIQVCSDPNQENETHHTSNCVADDCLCYDSVFRQDHPLETSSLKSDTSFSTESPQVSPKKKNRRHPSTSSLSDGSQNGSVNHPPRRSRIAAKFEQPLD